ncbi:MAG: ABC transporter ATP-binding protein [Spirochaetales bacterium]|nr:ABC transporter ATP-binding protein [Spirochaetales bacterium]
MRNETLLNIHELSRSFGGLKAVNNVSFAVRPGIIQAIIGPNGAGKTTLFNLISGRLKADSGSVFFKGVPITGLKPYKIARLGITCTFQTTKLFQHMTVLENVMAGCHIRFQADFFSCILALPKTWKQERKIRQTSEELLAKFDLTHYADEYAENLPFGKQRLVEFARALAAGPELLLLDEPAAGLNIYETAELSKFILTIKKLGITILIVEHDMSLIMDISDHIIVLDQGVLLTEGSPKQVQKNPDVVRVYLGDEHA